MNLREQLILVSDAYCAATGRARGTLSAVILKRGSRLDEIADAGGDVTTRNFERAMEWLSEHWPDAAIWPEDVPRPATSEAAA